MIKMMLVDQAFVFTTVDLKVCPLHYAWPFVRCLITFRSASPPAYPHR